MLIRSNARPGNRIGVGNGSTYDLHLTSELKVAKLVKASTSPAVTDVMVAQNIEVAAGVKQQLEADAKRVAGVRLLPGRFMLINQTMGLPKGCEASARYLGAFVEEMKASGFVATALVRHGIEGAAVARPRSLNVYTLLRPCKHGPTAMRWARLRPNKRRGLGWLLPGCLSDWHRRHVKNPGHAVLGQIRVPAKARRRIPSTA